MQRHITFLIVTVLSLSGMLAACGGGTPTPLPPSGLQADRAAAAHGEAVTLTGANLGTEGSVEIGGMPATADSWAQDEVVVTVPAGAPAGPQSLTLTTATGSQTLELFVGVDFASGTLEELAALGLPKGTAVRLGEGTFASTSPEVALDNLSLYGRGKTLTVIDSGADPQLLYLFADPGYELTVSDLTLRTFATLVAPSPVEPLAALAAADSRPLSVADLAASGMADLLSGAVAAQGAGSQLEAQAAADSSFTLRRVAIEEVGAGGGGFITASALGGPSTPRFYGGRFVAEDVKLTGANSIVYFLAGGEVELRQVDVATFGVAMGSVFATVAVHDSKVTASPNATSGSSMILLLGARGVEVVGSTLTANDGDISIAANVLGSGSIVVHFGDQSVITGNTLTATDTDTADGDNNGRLSFTFPPSAVLLADNTIEAHYSIAFETLGTVATVRDNDIALGAPGFAATELTVTDKAGSFDFSGNQVAFRSRGGLAFEGDGSELSLTANHVTGHAVSGTALTAYQAFVEPVEVTATGNRFQGFGQALRLEKRHDPSDTFTARINDNVFDFPIAASGSVAALRDMVAAGSDLDATRNVWGTNTSVATVESYISHFGNSTVGVLKVDPLTQP